MNNKENINRENYEVYIIDYMDDNLSSSDEDALFKFLSENHDLQQDFELLTDNTCETLQIEQINYPFSEKLKQKVIIPYSKIDESNYQDFFIAFHENDLNDDEKIQLDAFLEKNQFLIAEFEEFCKVKLIPDFIHFKNKKQLKHSVFANRKISWLASSIAAAILIFFLFKLANNDIAVNNTASISKTVQKKNNANINESHESPSFNNETANFTTQEAILQTNIKKKPSKNNVNALDVQQTQIVVRKKEGYISLIPASYSVLLIDNQIINLNIDLIELKQSQNKTDNILTQITNRGSIKDKPKKTFWNILLWGAKQYNHVASNPIVIYEIMNESSNEMTYYICKE